MTLNKNHILLSLIGALIAGQAVQATTWTAGHGDLGVALEDGTDFHFHVHLHSGTTVDGAALTEEEEYDAGDITINVPLMQQISAPGNASLSAGTGAATGEDLWILPQSNPAPDPVPFAGFASEELEASDWSSITFSLGTVTSPTGNGDFSLWQSDGFGGFDFYFSTADESLTENGDNTLLTAAGGHDHYNFGFTEAGTWLIELTASGTHDTLGFMSDTQTFTFNVVPEPSSYAAFAGLLALACGLARRRAHRA